MNKTSHIIIIISLLFSGCGKPAQYHVKEWKYATFIDSSTIGAVILDYMETQPNTKSFSVYPLVSICLIN
jgi:hypothetical protein